VDARTFNLRVLGSGEESGRGLARAGGSSVGGWRFGSKMEIASLEDWELRKGENRKRKESERFVPTVCEIYGLA
jgi:hypothetical protein